MEEYVINHYLNIILCKTDIVRGEKMLIDHVGQRLYYSSYIQNLRATEEFIMIMGALIGA